jgi:hypothetical protein
MKKKRLIKPEKSRQNTVRALCNSFNNVPGCCGMVGATGNEDDILF